jgi:6-pyruvoyl-tetrahydropterin synthase
MRYFQSHGAFSYGANRMELFKEFGIEAAHHLPNVPGLENPTSENLCAWIWRELTPSLPGLSKIVVRETCTSGCSCEGP